MTRDEWEAARIEIKTKLSEITYITYKMGSKLRTCERCGVNKFRYYFMKAPDGTELESMMKSDDPRFIKTTVCGDCLTPSEIEACEEVVRENMRRIIWRDEYEKGEKK